jgi:hypothetical protein
MPIIKTVEHNGDNNNIRIKIITLLFFTRLFRHGNDVPDLEKGEENPR